MIHMHTLTCWQQNGNLLDSHRWQTGGNKHGWKFCFVSDSGRKSRVERGFVRGVAVWQWGSIGLTSRSLGLWGRKRHRQEVRAGQNSLEMLYHHDQQATVSHQGRKKLRGLRVCAYVCISVPPCRNRSTWMHVCVTNITLSSRVFHSHADIVWFQPAPAKDLRKAFCFCFCFALPTTPDSTIREKWTETVWCYERRGVMEVVDTAHWVHWRQWHNPVNGKRAPLSKDAPLLVQQEPNCCTKTEQSLETDEPSNVTSLHFAYTFF